MSTVESHLANAYEVATDAAVGTTDLVFSVPSTAGSPTMPSWMVIEPDNSSQREYIYFVSKTATSFTADASGRYGQGSAAGSGLSHPVGSVIRSSPLQQHFEELWDKITEIEHTENHASRHQLGGADSLSPYFVPKTGGVFTGAPQYASDPVAANDLVRKAFVDTHANLAATAHGAVSAATVNTLVRRDASGRAAFADPSATGDAANKNYVDTHANLSSTHQAVSTNTASRIVIRDASARARFADPSNVQDAATKGYVDSRTTVDTEAAELFDDTVLSFGSNDTWTTASPSVIYQFTAPVSGKVIIGSACLVKNGGIATATIFMSGYRLGTTASGDEVQTESEIHRSARFQIFTTTPGYIGNTPVFVPVSGLTGGNTYFVTWRGKHINGAGGPVDVRARRVIVIPVK